MEYLKHLPDATPYGRTNAEATSRIVNAETRRVLSDAVPLTQKLLRARINLEKSKTASL